MNLSLPHLAYPGLLLGPSSHYSPGPGTHIHKSSIYASIAGQPTVAPPSSSPHRSSGSKTTTAAVPISTISILPIPPAPSILSPLVSNKNVLPAVGSEVLFRVTRLMAKQANVAILVVGEKELTFGGSGVCADQWAGVVRKEDIRALERDKVKVQEAFRVGDLGRGEVVSAKFAFLEEGRSPEKGIRGKVYWLNCPGH